MSDITRVTNQVELNAALKAKKQRIWLTGDRLFVVTDSAHVVAWDSAHVVAGDSAHVVARGSAHVEAGDSAHVEAGDSAHVEARGSAHVEARDSAHVVAGDSAHVEARGSAHVVAGGSAHVVAGGSAHVVAWGSAHVVAGDSAHVVAGSYVAVHRHATTARVTGGVIIDVRRPMTAAEWCAWYGVPVVDGVATVYKGVRADYRSYRGGDYTPGSIPIAEDWDGGVVECGGGLHFSPRPVMALEFDDQATRFLACPVRIADMRAPIKDDHYPQKIKARGCCGPVVEVDRWGTPVVDA